MKKIHISFPAAPALLLPASAALALGMFYLQPYTFGDVLEGFRESSYLIFIMNWAPVFLLTLFIYFLLSNPVASCAVVGTACLTLGLVNRNMIMLRHDPLKPYDLLLGGEFFGVAKSVDPALFMTAAALLAGTAVATAAGLLLIRTPKLKPSVRAAGAVLSAAAFLAFYFTAAGNTDLYGGMYMKGNPYNLLDNYQSKGFVYSFMHTLRNQSVKKPANYERDRRAIKNLTDGFVPSAHGGAKPNIVFVLGEAFSEIALSPNLDFTGYPDPLSNYKRIKGESISGDIIVPNIGGGTADTEFDIFTAINTRHFRGNPYSFNLVNKPISALPAWLSQIGYENAAVHPGYGWFYNRQNAYPRMGFSGFTDLDAFDKKDQKAMYISETAAVAKLLSVYDEFTVENPETPFFAFLITIQNHGPYKDRYGTEQNFYTNLDLSDESVNSLSNYFEGLADGDRELRVMTDWFEERPEPVVLVYFGDHMPSFSYEIYEALLYDEHGGEVWRQTWLNRAPYLIWLNRFARESGVIPGYPNIEGELMTSNYFGVYVLSLLGIGGLDPFADYAAEMLKKYPIVLEGRFAEKNAETLRPSADLPEDLSVLYSWEYMRIFE